MDEFEYIETRKVGLRARSKKEMYYLLSSPSGIYLPPLADCHHKFIYQLCYLEREKSLHCFDSIFYSL